MIIRGSRPSQTYTLIPIAAVEDAALSYKARGILIALLTMNPGEEISAERLAKLSTDGERAVKSGVKELEDAGYLVRTPDWNLLAVEVPGVGTPTLPIPEEQPQTEPLARPADAPTHWMPTDHAIRSAKNGCELLDWELYILRYLVRCKERKTQPDSGEWLRWLLEEEQKARIEEKRIERQGHSDDGQWWGVA